MMTKGKANVLTLVNFKCPRDLYEQFKRKVEQEGTASEFFRRAIELYLEGKFNPFKGVLPERRLKELIKEALLEVIKSHGLVITTEAKPVVSLQPLTEENLPSYLRDNPWLEILSQKGKIPEL